MEDNKEERASARGRVPVADDSTVLRSLVGNRVRMVAFGIPKAGDVLRSSRGFEAPPVGSAGLAGERPGMEGRRNMATQVIEAEKNGALASGRIRTSGPGAASRATWPTVRIETDTATYVGQVCVPETKRRLSDVLADERPFLHLVQVQINDDDEREPFLALNKRFIRTVRILDEGKSDLVLVAPSA
jgi:hypothetical protein